MVIYFTKNEGKNFFVGITCSFFNPVSIKVIINCSFCRVYNNQNYLYFKQLEVLNFI